METKARWLRFIARSTRSKSLLFFSCIKIATLMAFAAPVIGSISEYSGIELVGKMPGSIPDKSYDGIVLIVAASVAAPFVETCGIFAVYRLIRKRFGFNIYLTMVVSIALVLHFYDSGANMLVITMDFAIFGAFFDVWSARRSSRWAFWGVALIHSTYNSIILSFALCLNQWSVS